jgi:hypothetical protein
MGRLTSEFAFIGSLGNITAYKTSYSEKIIVRKKGGPSRQKLKTSPSYAILRRHNMEFGGRAVASKYIMRALWPLKPLGNYNIAGPLNRMMKTVQEKDTSSEFGNRHVLISLQPHLLEGLQLNTRTLFESTVRTALSFSLSRVERTARVTIPELVPGINFIVPDQYPWYRFVAVLGVVPDLIYTADGYKPAAENYSQLAAKISETPWALSLRPSAGTTLEIIFNETFPDTNHTLMLSVGIKFGKTGVSGLPEQVARVGSAKVLMIV